MPFFTGSGLPVTLTATASPLIGTTINLDSANLPPNTVLGGVSIGFSQINLPLAPLGAPGCFSLTNGNLTTLRLGASSSVALPIPNDANILGVSVYLQTAAIAPSTNALGVVTSNGLQLTLGNL